MRHILCLLLIWAGPAIAQPVTIRSGDHDSFARLVFAIPEDTPWEVGRIEGGVGLRLGAVADGISTEGVFDRIRRNRIGSVSVEGEIVAIRLVCDCHADAFLWRSDRLVIDIIDGPSPPDNPFEQDLPDGSDPMSGEARESLDLPILLPTGPRHTTLDEALPFRFQASDEAKSIDEAQVAVVSSLARAATEGLFDIPIEPVQRTFTAEDSTGDTERRVVGLSPVTDPMAELGNVLDRAGSPGLVLRSAFSDALAGQPLTDRAGEGCLPERDFAVATWGDDRDFADQISERRAALTTEFDRYPDGAIEALARSYIYFGFGAEARRVLTLDGAMTSERLILDELARIVDGSVLPGGRIAGQVACGGAASLWGILALGDLSGADDDVRGEAARAHRNLPHAMRAHLGPRLAAHFVAAGEHEMGQEILELVDQPGMPPPVEAELVRADIDAAEGEVASSRERLGTLAEDSARMPPAALADLLGLQIESGAPPSTEMIELGEVYLHEARPAGGDIVLASAIVRARIARSELDMAGQVLDEAIPSGTDAYRLLVNELLSARVDVLSDRDFLELAHSGLPSPTSPHSENDVAARLVELGFPRRALEVMTTPADAGTGPERRYLRAEAHAQLGDVLSVERELDGMQDDRARAIRIEVLSRAGDFSGALQQSLTGEDEAEQGEIAWRAGEWEVLESSQDELMQSVSRLARQPTLLAPNLAELEARSALLDEAVQTRQMAEELLGRFTLDDAAANAGQ